MWNFVFAYDRINDRILGNSFDLVKRRQLNYDVFIASWSQFGPGYLINFLIPNIKLIVLYLQS
jgi:hypothetical protein